MRWQVEISTIGSEGTSESNVFDADSWQGALEQARAKLGDVGPMGGFSIDLLKEGYRAVDGATQRRYVIKALGVDVNAAPPASSATPPPPQVASEATKGSTARIAAAPQVPAKETASTEVSTKQDPEKEIAAKETTSKEPAKPSEPPKPNVPRPGDASAERVIPRPATSAGRSLSKKLAGLAPSEPPPAQADAVKATEAAKPAESVVEKTAELPKVEAAKEAELAKTESRSVPPVAPKSPSFPPKYPQATLLSHREQEPSDKSPLTYRELAYALPIGTDETGAEAFAKDVLAAIRARLPEGRTACFVNVAIFDEIFTGRPTVAPLAVVQWKDWKGDPVTEFPRRSPMSLPAPPPMGFASQPPMGFPSMPIPNLGGASHGSPGLFQGPATTPSNRPPAMRAPEPTGDELVAIFFEEIHNLQFQADAVDAGYFCLDLALSKLPAKGGLVHFYDLEKREYVVACARGADSLLLARHPDADAFLGQAPKTKTARVLFPEGTPPPRYFLFGGMISSIIAPLWPHGRFMGAIEFINPIKGGYTQDDANALTYLAEQLAEYIGSRGIVLEPTRIAKRVATA